MKTPDNSPALRALSRDGPLRSRDLEALGLSRERIRQLTKQGVIQRVARGLYSLPGSEQTEHSGLIEICKTVPHGVICLLSALRFHEIGTQSPTEIWLAIDRKAWLPTAKDIPVRIVRFSSDILKAGAEKHRLEKGLVRVTSPAKTVADCFKYRNKIGLDVALEALREGWREKRFSMDEIWRFAKVCRVAKVMRPYMEALIC
ncbi:AbiEi antitoxin N-terminal domain-containing protein [Candidatus Sumerlaeota bacterium]|nr:AbiEi antitoxin N-terminal domain-containing protein [Candidatus Sumerlaeota bacterium]